MLKTCKGGIRLDLEVGDEVYWNDPDDDLCSGNFIISEFLDNDIAFLVSEDGTELEAFLCEIS